MAKRPKDADPPDYYSSGEVARIFGVTSRTVANWCDRGLLPYIETPAGHRRIPTSAIKGGRVYDEQLAVFQQRMKERRGNTPVPTGEQIAKSLRAERRAGPTRQPKVMKASAGAERREQEHPDGAPAATIYELKVMLLGVRPPVWRRFQVRSDIPLGQLHDIVQVVMGWENCHLHQFGSFAGAYGSPEGDPGVDGQPLQQVLSQLQQKLYYQYDFGDNWEHELQLEKVLKVAPGKTFPVCVAGKRACPPEDCGGPWGYAELLKILKNPRHREYRERKEWVGSRFHPEQFAIDDVNAELKKLVRRTRRND